ncbi:hypothetical protein COS66_01260 [Candidatus Berkelbacteria bacterium CG06_land_8_20_14_3_00_43_10]|uniref:Uncharacterized protein n=1 Tax=Candidatus Berkelbacteria bacterium CG10_big_fil_rev_8_21_14_0_10_43_14 TaxID=1974515 RepID=A0A2M6R8R3_9BACT|nr:MAG: hypothetical protein AUK41_03725 [Candidatus Berkelbacteria bacterium CG2_30_43_20]PIS06988.1 MAG: hypothetical protein COT79_01505 [Candidatus Berkelbacteria bacterium CG10_big_fil_rev_8_21_14_0_10_43_14]PIU87369.1 MAG: hypothetical protein COS66_01260 [Candidatus Berkelbacteria bacterium CG06_land_8_20_14_3_00_43_10]
MVIASPSASSAKQSGKIATDCVLATTSGSQFLIKDRDKLPRYDTIIKKSIHIQSIFYILHLIFYINLL